MQNLLYTSATVVITAIVTSVGITSLVDSKIEREQRLRQQITTELNGLDKEVAQINRRLEMMEFTKPVQARHADYREDRVVLADELPFDDSDEVLRELVINVIQEERLARQAAFQESQWKRLRNWKDNRHGPYGQYNARVNTITGIIDLDYTQASYYHTLLAEYEEQAAVLYEGISSRIADQGSDLDNLQQVLDEVELEKRSLDATFDQAFVQMLSPEQASRYEELPPEERGIGPNAGLSRMQLELGDLQKLANDPSD
jgi:hypothetical protein